MGKIATKYLKVHPTKIVEDGFHPERNQVSEAVFSQSNEFMGVRGSLDEGSSYPSLRGSYFNGIYDYALKENNSTYKGIIKRTHFMINSVDYFKIKLICADEVLDLAKINYHSFQRELDLLSGVLTRSLVWLTHQGAAITVKITRFLHLESCHRAYQQIELSSNQACKVDLSFQQDAHVLHWGQDCYHRSLAEFQTTDYVGVLTKTRTSGQKVLSLMTVKSDYEAEISTQKMQTSYRYIFQLSPGKTAKFQRYVVNQIARKSRTSSTKLLNEAREELAFSVIQGFERAIAENKAYFAKLYQKSDIEIVGNDEDQQGIRYCIYMLNTNYHGFSPLDNIGAKGLTGEAYSGHAFWDSETYCLPYYLFNDLPAAKNLLLFRYNTLAKAQQRAKMLDCRGACYPIATLNGEEGCDLWQHASLQFQPSTGVVYAIYHYDVLTNDEDFLKNYGLEMVLEVAKFLLDRGQWDQNHQYFGYYGVMGPDEFKMMVNHNTYTNLMAKFTFDYALQLIQRIKNIDYVLKKCEITDEFLHKIQEASRHMKILYDENTGLFEQNEGFYNLPHIDIHKIPQEDFPLYSHWTYDRIYRGDMIKQPDVLMFIFLFLTKFSREEKLANYNYYEPRCIHESSLSPSIHSIIASELGNEQAALDFFGFASRLDLDDYNRNTSEGLHMTSIAAAWLNIVYGFGGLRSDTYPLSIRPTLPAKWQSYSFKFNYHDAIIQVTVNQESVVLFNSGLPVKIKVYDELVILNEQLTIKR